MPLPLMAIFHYLENNLKTGKKPSAKILEKFSDRYDWLKKKIIESGMVENDLSDIKIDKPTTIHVTKTTGFSLWLGKSTGLLSTLWHRAGMAANQQVTLTLEDACQNNSVLVDIGSGKTIVYAQLCSECLDQQ